MPSIEQIIAHYQKEIEKISSRPERVIKYEDRLLHCLTKLSKLAVTVNHLQVTGVGKTVNALRKLQIKNGVIDAAKALVAKWKNMVIEEDDGDEETAQSESRLDDAKRIQLIRQQERGEYSPDEVSDGGVDYRPSHANPHYNNYSPENVSHNAEYSDVKEYSPSKNCYAPNGYSPGSPKSNGIEVYCYSPSKKPDKSDEKRRKDKIDGRKEKEKKEEKRRKSEAVSGGDVVDSKCHKKLDKDKSSSHQKASHHETKTEHRSSSSKNSASYGDSSFSSKDRPSTSGLISSKSKYTKKAPVDDGIDSLSGASFAQALGPMVVKKGTFSSPPKKKLRTDLEEPRSSGSQSSSSKSTSKSTEKLQTSSSSSSSKSLAPPAQFLLDDVAGPSHLAPLDMEVVSTLSVPTPNYRPMPQPPLTSLERKQRLQNEEDALERIMSNRHKNTRTKVYSGIKGSLSHVPSLYEICCDVLKLHIDALEYTGGIPYSLLKPVLDGATPAQLYQFEHFNAYMIGDTEHLWQFHVNREFRGETREEMETWRDMYLRCMDEREEKYKAVTANIQESLKKCVPVRQTKLAYVDVAKPPRSVLRKQMKNGTSRPDAERLMGKSTATAIVKPPGRHLERPRVSPIFKPKVAPLMQKTLKSIKQTRFKR